jgi:hypothetical protein
MSDKSNKALVFFDEALPLRVERKITGANAHDARCLLNRYGHYCGRYTYKGMVNPLKAEWAREVLRIFANGQAATIAEAEKLLEARAKKDRRITPVR